MLLCILSFIVLAIKTECQELNTTGDKIQHQIESGIKFMCTNQFGSNGQFLYEIKLRSDTIDINVEHNNAPRQGGGLYSIGMYYRLNHNTHNDSEQGFSIIHCIDNSMRYLSSVSLPIVFNNETSNKNRAELIAGNTGATALALLGLTEICIINDDICAKYIQQFLLWVKGLIAMRDHKLVSDKHILKSGAFVKKLTENEASSPYYDSESYFTLSHLLRYQKYLLHVLQTGDGELWQQILDIVSGLDEYYIEYTDYNDWHWLTQAWYNRWVLLNENQNQLNQFQNHYLVQILMKNKLETILDLSYNGARCYLVEAITDAIHAVQMQMVNSKYNKYVASETNPLYAFNQTLWNVLIKRYKYMSERQLFKHQVDFYFENRFDGGFVADSSHKRMRIDDTQHCVSALMKLNALLFMNDHTLYSYMD